MLHNAKRIMINSLLIITIVSLAPLFTENNSVIYAQQHAKNIYDLYDLVVCGKIVAKDNKGFEEISGPIYTIEIESNYKNDTFYNILNAIGSEDSNGPRSMLPLEIGQNAIFYVNSIRGDHYVLSPYTAKISECNSDYDPTPLGQYKFGVNAKEIHCVDDYVLVIKYNGSPACVTESTKTKLIERGWADSKIQLSNSTTDWGSMKLVYNDDGLYCNTVNKGSFDHCYSLEAVVFGNARRDGWTVYPGGAGWMPPDNSELTRIYKEVEFGMRPLNFTAMLDDKIFVNKCESNGGTWNYTHHDCEGLW